MDKKKKITFVLKGLTKDTRLDRAIRQQIPDFGRRRVQALINAKRTRVNGRVVWLCSWQTKNGDRIEIDAQMPKEKVKTGDFDESWLIEQQSDIIAINKPSGVLSHKTRSNAIGDILSLSTERFGAVFLFHRLDRDTSGIMLLTKNSKINRYLDKAFKESTIKKEYLALVPLSNWLEQSGIIENHMASHKNRREKMMISEHGGKRAITEYEIVAETDEVALVRLFPKTGRTHQLRVHMASLDSPIFGDRLYGSKQAKAKRLMLHAKKIILPKEGDFPERQFEAKLPDDFIAVLPKELRKIAREL